MTTTGSTKSGQNILLLCNVTTAAILSVRPDIMWVKIENGMDTEMPVVFKNLTTPTSTILSLPFPSLAFSHRGIYRCVVDLNISSVTEFIITRDINLTVECERAHARLYKHAFCNNTIFFSCSSSSHSGSPTC